MEGGGVPEFFNISPPHRHKFDVKKPGNYNKVGSEVIERLHFLASLPLAVPHRWKAAELGLLRITSYPIIAPCLSGLNSYKHLTLGGSASQFK